MSNTSYDPIPYNLMQKIRVMSECDEVREIPDFPLYAITLTGQVWTVRQAGGLIDLRRIPHRMKPSLHDKRETITLRNSAGEKKNHSIAWFLLTVFVSPAPFENANASSLDGNPLNYALDNLVWSTPEERASRALKRNGNPLPEHGTSKLSVDDIQQMKLDYLAGATFAELAQKYQIHKISVRLAVRGISWKAAGDGVAVTFKNIALGSKASKAKLTEDQVREIKRRLATGDLQKDIARDYGVTAPSIHAIASGKNWSHITV